MSRRTKTYSPTTKQPSLITVGRWKRTRERNDATGTTPRHKDGGSTRHCRKHNSEAPADPMGRQSALQWFPPILHPHFFFFICCFLSPEMRANSTLLPYGGPPVFGSPTFLWRYPSHARTQLSLSSESLTSLRFYWVTFSHIHHYTFLSRGLRWDSDDFTGYLLGLRKT